MCQGLCSGKAAIPYVDALKPGSVGRRQRQLEMMARWRRSSILSGKHPLRSGMEGTDQQVKLLPHPPDRFLEFVDVVVGAERQRIGATKPDPRAAGMIAPGSQGAAHFPTQIV